MEAELIDITKVTTQAKKEIDEEKFRDQVEAEKERLKRKRPFLHRLFPFTIKIVRR